MEEIVNKVANSKLLTLDLEQYLPESNPLVLDIKDGLFQELILKEMDFRSWVKEVSTQNAGKLVSITNGSEGIVPKWAFMLLSSALIKQDAKVVYGDSKNALETLILAKVEAEFFTPLQENAFVVVKGCAKVELSHEFYGKLTQLLIPKCKSLMFGEPCSTVPIYKA